MSIRSASQRHNTREFMCREKVACLRLAWLIFHAVSNFAPSSPSGREFLLVNHFYLSALIQCHKQATCIIKAKLSITTDTTPGIKQSLPFCSLDLCTPKLMKPVMSVSVAGDESKTTTECLHEKKL